MGGITVSGGTLDLGGQGQSTSGVVSFQGGIVQNGTLTEIGTAAFDAQSGAVSAVLAGMAGLNKSTAGLFVLSGANTYTGTTSIGAGTLQVGSGGAPPGSGEFLASPSVANSGSLVFNHADSLTYGGVISGPGAVTKLGGGVLTLGGADSLHGVTTVSGGVLNAPLLAVGGAPARSASPPAPRATWSSTAAPCNTRAARRPAPIGSSPSVQAAPPWTPPATPPGP